MHMRAQNGAAIKKRDLLLGISVGPHVEGREPSPTIQCLCTFVMAAINYAGAV